MAKLQDIPEGEIMFGTESALGKSQRPNGMPRDSIFQGMRSLAEAEHVLNENAGLCEIKDLPALNNLYERLAKSREQIQIAWAELELALVVPGNRCKLTHPHTRKPLHLHNVWCNFCYTR